MRPTGMVFLTVLAAWGGITPPPAPASAPPTPGCETSSFVLSEHQLFFRLPHPFLRAGSDSVWTRTGPWRRTIDYEVDLASGELRLLSAPSAGETLWVKVCRLLSPPPLVLQRRSYHPVSAVLESLAAPAAAAPPRPATSRDPASAGMALRLSGNKTVAVDFGSSQDASLRQSLDLTVSGSLAQGVELAAVISDRNTPLTAAGATQDLQALDRVLLELRAPRGGASLGDISLEANQGEFGRLSRRLQGARGEWSTSGLTTFFAGASSQGEFHSLQFFGQDARQGPYRLTDRAGRSGVPVIAGSEVVFVDGARMTRGESADYSMDYDRGELTFSNRRPISSSSRITVDYQYSLDRFHRNLAATSTRWERGSLSLFSQFISEADDRGRPLGLPLAPEDRLVLGAAGDSASRAFSPGVGTGPGDYDLVARDAALSYFAFAGPQSGLYSVSFAYVGSGRGEYADSAQVAGRTVYRYVGAGLGAYRPGRSLPLPESHRLWSLGTNWKGGKWSLEGEGALSGLDRNTFSTLDNADDDGRAGKLLAAWQSGLSGLPGRALSRAGISALYRAVDGAFQPFSRLERPFANEDWGLPLGADLDHQERLALGAFLRPRPGGELRGELSRLRLPTGFAALRRSAEWQNDGVLAARGRWERSEGEQSGLRFPGGGREKRVGELRWRGSFVEPLLRADWDERRAPSDTAQQGERYRAWGAELRSPAGRRLALSVGHDRRLDEKLSPDRWVEQFASRTWRAGAELQAGSFGFASLGVQRLERLPRAQAGRTRSDLGFSRLQLATEDRRWTGSLSVEATSEAQSRRRRQASYVGPGAGAYDSLGNFVGRGDYSLLLIADGELERVTRGAASLHTQWEWGRAALWRGSRAGLDIESEARRRGDLRGDQLALSPVRARGEASLDQASVLWRLDQELAPDSPLGGLRVLLEERATADRGFVNFAQVTDQRLVSARWRARPREGYTVELEGRHKRQQGFQQYAAGTRVDRSLLERGMNLALARAQGARWRIAVAGDGSWTALDQAGTVRSLRAGPEGWWAVGERARLEWRGRRSWSQGLEVPRLFPTAPAELIPRWEGMVRVDYRLPPNTQFSTSLDGRSGSGGPARMQGRAELRVFF